MGRGLCSPSGHPGPSWLRLLHKTSRPPWKGRLGINELATQTISRTCDSEAEAELQQ
ncbi:uncharacterized protein MYCFIDRAFT_184187 [Pseudocercospora fijiensis CIRAD86]|uniref:Uncharacterized protein n=1 Tax=Pseudocercospora fijiensis (strain CIRAD86) TaxID=383855 RepID=M3AJB9_PSEFD|nr:uncharacterized protein MYCFIDRAFT_184187 [Pseudocercospora fijiensis CIRAD86]EME77253.1 hypothetical protein MYCFIDRAFT_184187 [Pseudocercospora fijiensis CIRAD86]